MPENDFIENQEQFLDPTGNLFAELEKEDAVEKTDDQEEEDIFGGLEKKDDDEGKEEKPAGTKTTDESEEESGTKEDKEKGEEVNPDDFPEDAVVDLFFAKIEDKWGWDVPEGLRPKSIDDFIKFFDNVVEESSVPQYASDEVREFDEYVRNGGSKNEFFQTYSKKVELDSIDVNNEQHQETVISEWLKTKSFSDEKIKRYIDRAKADESIAQETADALEELRTIRKTEHDNNLKQQKKLDDERKQSEARFVNDINEKLKTIKNIAGLEISVKERDALERYIFDTGRDAKTQQQKDFEEDPVLYTIVTAYAYQNRDKILNLLEKKAYTKAAERYNERLNQLRDKGKTKSNVQIGKTESSFLDLLDKQ